MNGSDRCRSDLAFTKGAKGMLLVSLVALVAVLAVPLVAEQRYEPMQTAAVPTPKLRDNRARGVTFALPDTSAPPSALVTSAVQHSEPAATS